MMELTEQQQEEISWRTLRKEMMESKGLNYAFREFNGDRKIRTRTGKIQWLIDHVPLDELEPYFNFQHVRVCVHCGKPMSWGYLMELGDTYCSDECLHHYFTEEEFLAMYDEGRGDSYYTTWIE
ncbi:MAG: hypothetical protein J6I36_04690 [Bacteroidaceae bacterium]|jgi:hypothetical protein|nr:hypothetical protein [Bacteroidaceae bacterium]